MHLPAPLGRQLDRLSRQATVPGPDEATVPREATPGGDRQSIPASLASEDAEHRHGGRFRLVVSNLDRAARAAHGPARISTGAAASRASTPSRFYTNLACPGLRDTQVCSGQLRKLG